ncbi:MAG: hypothetical protein MJZ07_09615 [Bacteroidales bacterium]|nr:hypothetical protein [Bacteroidales bacterium]
MLTGSDKLADVPEWAESKNDFAAYFEASMLAEFTRDEAIKYQDEMTTENDWKNALEFARELGEENGRKKGLEEGRAEGIAEGEANGKLEAARNMKAKGYDINEIVDITGLSLEQIKTL